MGMVWNGSLRNHQSENINPGKDWHLFFGLDFTNPGICDIITNGLPMARFADYRSIPTFHPPFAELWVHPEIL